MSCIISEQSGSSDSSTVRGVGGGKTRLLEEIRARLNADQKTVVVAITFNSNSSYSSLDELFFQDQKYFTLNLILSIFCRILPVIYDISFSEARSKISELASEMELSRCSDLVEEFGRNFLQRIIVDVERSQATQSTSDSRINKFVLLVDEVMKVEDEDKSYLERSCSSTTETCLGQVFYWVRLP